MSSKRKHLEIGYDEDSEKKVKAEEAVVQFSDVAVLPEADDNCAIARLALAQGTKLKFKDSVLQLDYPILEGHRFAIAKIEKDEPLLSWGLRFGVCSRTILPGNYVTNKKMLESLGSRGITNLPAEPNFYDKIEPYILDEKKFSPAEQVPLYPESERGSFQGYKREGKRGVGTRNYVVLIGTTSLSRSYIKALESKVKGLEASYSNVDGVAAINHTECGGKTRPHNFELVIRTLAGFVVHPNCGAVLIVDFGDEVLTGKDLKEYMKEHKYALDNVAHEFLQISGVDPDEDLKKGEAAARRLIVHANKAERTKQPLSELRIALQCGGSDAFSGVSGNPTAAYSAMELIRHGGAALLAETPELIGAESYIMKKVVDLATAKRFLDVVERYKRLSEFHGFTAEQNPSGGNNFRGLYNIALKSIGAAKKKNADVRLDCVLDYAEPIGKVGRGYYFMDSPGNDLESIAGQVATGCNFIYFITGNGSVTNFPFVPTIKILTTTSRYELLKKDMDFNAGRFQDAGVPISTLGMELFALTQKNASGVKTVGERAGHSQVVIWRDWAFEEKVDLTQFTQVARDGKALQLKAGAYKDVEAPTYEAKVYDSDGTKSWDRIGLVLPTSLCSGEVSAMIVKKLNQEIEEEKKKDPSERPLSSKVARFVALPHTEGCGTGYSNQGEQIYVRTMVGHLLHPNVRYALLLEHGCEKHHNDFMRTHLKEHKADIHRFGWASVQLDGGLDSVKDKCIKWFDEQIKRPSTEKEVKAGLESVSLGVYVTEELPSAVSEYFAALVHVITAAGGTVVVPSTSSLLSSPLFLDDAVERGSVTPSLAFGQKFDAKHNGCHIMDTPTTHPVETVTGLCATGVSAVLVFTTRAAQGHPIIPVIQVTTSTSKYGGADLVLEIDEESETYPKKWLENTFDLLKKVSTRAYAPKAQSFPDFQLSRGKTAFST